MSNNFDRQGIVIPITGIFHTIPPHFAFEKANKHKSLVSYDIMNFFHYGLFRDKSSIYSIILP